MKEQGRDRREAWACRDTVAAWLAVILVEGMLGTWLVRLPVPVGAVDVDDALTVEFIRRPKRGATTLPNVRSAARPRDGESSSGQVSVGRSGVARLVTSSPMPATTSTAMPAPFDLHPPPSPASSFEPEREAFARPPALDVRRTRFADAWVPEGDALKQASFRSSAVRMALGAFGGPPRRCSDIERRLRKANCLPLHGREDDDEALRRRLDP